MNFVFNFYFIFEARLWVRCGPIATKKFNCLDGQKKFNCHFWRLKKKWVFFSHFWDRIHVVKMRLGCGLVVIKNSLPFKRKSKFSHHFLMARNLIIFRIGDWNQVVRSNNLNFFFCNRNCWFPLGKILPLHEKLMFLLRMTPCWP